MRWWDGLGWTEHVALPDDDDEQPAGAAQSSTGSHLSLVVDDGVLRPRPRDEVFRGAPRGPVRSERELARIDRDALVGARGLIMLGAGAMALLMGFLAVKGLGGSSWVSGLGAGIAIVLALALPVLARALLQQQARAEFWWRFCGSRGFDVADVGELATAARRSPLLGIEPSLVVEQLARRELAGREAWIGTAARIDPTPGSGERPEPAPRVWRTSFMVMPIPELAAARWPGLSIRADHHARRPGAMRAMLGPLVQRMIAGTQAHVAAGEEQDPIVAAQLVDERVETFLLEHPLDVDVVGGMLVATREGTVGECELLEELCRDTLVIHELLVPEHELPARDEGSDHAAP